MAVFDLTLLSFLDKPENLILFYYVLARVTGIFIVSPLLSNQAATTTVRVFITIFISLLLTITLYPEYSHISSPYLLSGLSHLEYSWIPFSLNVLKELAIGYLLGFCFALIFEAVLLAGELIDAMTGFATPSTYNPMSGSNTNLLGPILLCAAALMALGMDMHHDFIRIIVESFKVIPLGDYHLPRDMLIHVTNGTGLLFDYAIKMAAIPFVILACATIGIGFTVRVVPEFNPLLLGLPMRVFVAYFTIMLAISYVPPIIRAAFQDFAQMSLVLMHHIAGQ